MASPMGDAQVTDPYLNLFRNLIPPIMGQIDMTPIFGFLVLQFAAQVLGTDDII
jgi:YggT family protein